MKNIDRVFQAWKAKVNLTAGNVLVRNGVVYSYGVKLLYRDADDNIVLNNMRYSHTTSTHQNELRRSLIAEGICFVETERTLAEQL